MLQVEDVRIGYGDSNVIWDVNLEVDSNSVVSILGRNGAGKTTLLRGIIGQNPPTKGEIRFKGETISGLKPYQIAASGIGYVPQSRDIFGSISVENNIRLGSASQSGRLLKEDIEEFIFEYFPALEEKRNAKGSTLSGGQQQQLAIARALNSNPDLLLLDEPSEGIQPSIVKEIGTQLNRLSDEQDISVLIVEQNLDLVKNVADYCYILESGNIVEQNELDFLLEENLIEKHLSI
jgi:urea ABC transporter ATP-binding protein UrtE